MPVDKNGNLLPVIFDAVKVNSSDVANVAVANFNDLLDFEATPRIWSRSEYANFKTMAETDHV
jgi:hypothetical protein